MKYAIAAFVCLAVLCLTARAAEFEQKWLYFGPNVESAEGVDKAIEILKNAKDAGCTHVLNSGSTHLRLDGLTEEQLAGIERFKAAAEELDLVVIPAIFPSGYGGRYLHFDKGLAAGLPVKGAPFVVENSRALPDPRAVPALANGAFDFFDGDMFEGWEAQGFPGKHSFADTEVKHGGEASLKITDLENLPEDANSSVRLSQTLAVTPFRRYFLSVWVKADNIQAEREAFIYITSGDGKRRNTYTNLRVDADQDWTRHTITLNTLEADHITISAGVSDATAGTVWFDDMEITPAGLVNVLRREATPFVVTDAQGTTIYEEGADYAPVSDPLMDPYDLTHEAPAIEIPEGSRIKDGDRILVSWYHPALIYSDQINLSISDPKIFELMAWEMQQVVKLWDAPGYFMNIDEIRIGGWEGLPGAEVLTPGQELARYTERAVDIVEKAAPEADIYVWSDMYTPHHNARPFEARNAYYYLVNGNWDGAWDALPSKVIIMNWYSPTKEAVEWFAERGHTQVLCGYYDGALKPNIQKWMDVTDGVDGVVGMMYTTWRRNYDNVEEFFRLVDEYPAWVEDEGAEDALSEK